MAEYVDSQLAMAERPTSQVNLGIHYADRGAIDAAIEAYEVAIALDPGYVPAYARRRSPSCVPVACPVERKIGW
jgi:lipoprotein NlpI